MFNIATCCVIMQFVNNKRHKGLEMENFKNEKVLITRIKKLVKDYRGTENQIKSYLKIAEMDLASIRKEIAQLAMKGKKQFGISFKHMAKKIDIKEVTLNSWIQKERLNNEKITHIEKTIESKGEKKNKKAIDKIKKIIKEKPKTTKHEALVLYNQEKIKTKDDVKFDRILALAVEVYSFVRSANLNKFPSKKIKTLQTIIEKILYEFTGNIMIDSTKGAESAKLQ